MSDDDKKLAAEAAVSEVRDGMVLGLGTGSTARYAVAAVGRLVAQGMRLQAVATSRATAEQAAAEGIALLDMADVARLDLTIDGADEIDRRFVAIKGAGGAMLREKVVAAASARMVVIADGSKRVERVGAAKLPVEILPFARASVLARLEALGARVEVRLASGVEVRTDGGNLVADCRFGSIDDPRGLAGALSAIPGVLGHGLFLDEVAAAYVATDGVVEHLERGRTSG